MPKSKTPTTRSRVRALTDLRRAASQSFATEQSRLHPSRWDDAVDAAARALNDRDHLLWLIQRARTIRDAKGWKARERAVSWKDWDMHADIALGLTEGTRRG